MFPYCLPKAPYTTARPTNEPAATPQTFLMTFIPPHFPSIETHTHLTRPHPDDYHSPQCGPSSLPSPHLHQSVISCQAPSGPRLFSASCSIRMQQAINAINAWGRPSATGDPQPQYLWCHQIKGGRAAGYHHDLDSICFTFSNFCLKDLFGFHLLEPLPLLTVRKEGEGMRGKDCRNVLWCSMSCRWAKQVLLLTNGNLLNLGLLSLVPWRLQIKSDEQTLLSRTAPCKNRQWWTGIYHKQLKKSWQVAGGFWKKNVSMILASK